MPSVVIAGYQFQGPYASPDKIPDQPGIYAILRMLADGSLRVIDIGTAGEGMHPDSQGVQRRLKGHDRKGCWVTHCPEDQLRYAFRSEPIPDIRHHLEDELRWKSDPPCGANPWDINSNVPEPWSPAAMEQRYGPRGSGDVVVV